MSFWPSFCTQPGVMPLGLHGYSITPRFPPIVELEHV